MPKIVFFGFNNTLTKIDSTPSYYINSMGIPQFNRRPTEDSYLHGKIDSESCQKTGIDQVFNHDASQLSAIITRDFDPDYIAGFIAGILGKELHRVEGLGSCSVGLTQITEYQVEGELTPLFISHYTYIPSFHYHKIWDQDKNHQIETLYQELLHRRLVCPMEKIDYYDTAFHDLNRARWKFPFLNAHHVLMENVFSVESLDSLRSPLNLNINEGRGHASTDSISYPAIRRALPLCASVLSSLSLFAYRGTAVTSGELGIAAVAGLIMGEAGMVGVESKCVIS